MYYSPKPHPPATLSCIVIATLVLGCFGLQATNSPVQLRLAIPASLRHPVLSWDAQPGAAYLILSKTNLSDPWTPVEPVASSSNVARWTGPELNASSDPARFYSLLAPQPAIVSVEPAIAAPSGGVLNVIGQCLGVGGSVRVGGLVIPANVLVAGYAYSFTLPPLPQGTYDIEWLEGGKTIALLEKAITVTSPPGSILQRLMEPPSEPPGSPMGITEGKKGLNAVNVKQCFAKGVAQVGLGVVGRLSNGEPLDCDDDDRGGFPFALRMKAKEKANRTQCHLRVLPSTAEVQMEEVDMVLPGRGLDLIWARTYRSRTGRTTPMGINWDHSYNISAVQDPAGIAVYDGTGRRDVYVPGTNGFYTCDELFNEGTFSNGAFVLIFPDTSLWEFRRFDGSATSGKIARIADRNGNALTLSYSSGGQLNTIVDTLNRTNTIGYTPDGFVSSFKDFSGRVMTYDYAKPGLPGYAPGTLASATTPPVVGTPNGNDFPTGKTTKYAYSSGFSDDRLNRNLTSITDPKGQLAFQIVYSTNQDPASVAFDTVDYVQSGAYRSFIRRHPRAPVIQFRFAVVECVVNDPLGNVTEYFFDSRNRCVRQLDYTGRAVPDLPTTDVDNRPVNKLRPTDPDFFETLMDWDIDSLCTRVTHPRGDITEMVFQRAFNQNSARSNHARRHDADLRVLREIACCNGADTDGDGVSDITERAWRFEYDSRFGTGYRVKVRFPWLPNSSEDQTSWARGPRQTVSLDGSFARGPRQTVSLDGSWARGPRQTVSLDGSYDPHISLEREKERPFCNQFDVDLNPDITRVIMDPRGGTEECTYDPHGNRLTHAGRLLENGDRPVETYEYNAYGQMTARVHAADGEGRHRRDECTYYDSGPQTGYLRDHIADCVAAGFHLTNTFEYDARGNVTRHVNPRGFDSLATYNSLNQATTRQTPKRDFGDLVRSTTTYTYDANDNIVQVDFENRDATGALDPENPSWTHVAEYDLQNRRTLVAHEAAHVVQQQGGVQLRWVTNRFLYDGNDNIVLHQKPEAVSGADPNNIQSFQYDERDLLFRSLEAPGTGLASTNQYDYNANGARVKILKMDSYRVTIKQSVHDGFNRCVQVTDEMGNVVSMAFDANDNLILERVAGETNDIPGSANNRLLSETRYDYDALDRLVRSRMSFFDVFTELAIGDGQSLHSCTYAPNGLVLSTTDDNGHTTRHTYDSVDRLSVITDPRTNMVLFVRDRAGNIVTTTSIDRSDLSAVEQTFVITRVFDGLNRCVSSSDNVGNTEQFSYDSRDNCVQARDARGNDMIRVLDGLNRVTDTMHYDGARETGILINTTHVEYFNERCLGTTDGNGNTTRYAYDSVDRHVTTTNADGTRMSLVWSPRSNISRMTDPNGTIIDYTYDLLDRCVRKDITLSPGTTVAPTTTFEEFSYDGLSRLTRGTNNTSMVEFTYDSMGNRFKAKADCIAASATFDGEGNRLSLNYPSERQVQFTRDVLDRVVSVGTLAPGSALITLATYGFDGPDRLARISLANNINTRINWNGIQNPPNSAGDFGFQQVARINHARTGGSPVIDQRVFAYDPTQNKKLRAQTAPYSTGGPTATNAWSHDALDRLLRSTRTRGATTEADTTYIIDPMGNRTNVIHFSLVDVYDMNTALPEPADAQMNQYTFTPFGHLNYDANGNLVSRDSAAGLTLYRYDYADRLVSVERPGGVILASFTYDVLGRRISKTVYPPVPVAPVTTQFIHDPQSDCDSIIEMRQGGVMISTFVLPEVDDEVLVAFTAAGGAIYFHRDDLGNVLALTDATGNVLERYEYEDYGAPSFLDSKGAPILSGGQPVHASPIGNPFLFRGMFWDSETGLYFGSSRIPGSPTYVDPDLGQGVSRYTGDSSICTAARHPRAFAANNPWTGEPVCMKKGTVKFFNETKGFGRARMEVLFNPKEYTLRKVTVRGWNPETKEEIVGEANPHGAQMSGAQNNPMFKEHKNQGQMVGKSNPLFEGSGSAGQNPIYDNGTHRPGRPVFGTITFKAYRPGRPVFGNITFEGSDLYARLGSGRQKNWLPCNFRLN